MCDESQRVESALIEVGTTTFSGIFLTKFIGVSRQRFACAAFGPAPGTLELQLRGAAREVVSLVFASPAPTLALLHVSCTLGEGGADP